MASLDLFVQFDPTLPYHAVARGWERQVFRDVETASKRVRDYPWARAKSFAQLEAAEAFVQYGGSDRLDVVRRRPRAPDDDRASTSSASAAADGEKAKPRRAPHLMRPDSAGGFGCNTTFDCIRHFIGVSQTQRSAAFAIVADLTNERQRVRYDDTSINFAAPVDPTTALEGCALERAYVVGAIAVVEHELRRDDAILRDLKTGRLTADHTPRRIAIVAGDGCLPRGFARTPGWLASHFREAPEYAKHDRALWARLFLATKDRRSRIAEMIRVLQAAATTLPAGSGNDPRTVSQIQSRVDATAPRGFSADRLLQRFPEALLATHDAEAINAFTFGMTVFEFPKPVDTDDGLEDARRMEEATNRARAAAERQIQLHSS